MKDMGQQVYESGQPDVTLVRKLTDPVQGNSVVAPLNMALRLMKGASVGGLVHGDNHLERRAAVLFAAGYGWMSGCKDLDEYLMGSDSRNVYPIPLAPTDWPLKERRVVLVDPRPDPAVMAAWLGVQLNCHPDDFRNLASRFLRPYWIVRGYERSLVSQLKDESIGKVLGARGMLLTEALCAIAQNAMDKHQPTWLLGVVKGDRGMILEWTGGGWEVSWDWLPELRESVSFVVCSRIVNRGTA